MTLEEFTKAEPTLAQALRYYVREEDIIDGVYLTDDGKWNAHVLIASCWYAFEIAWTGPCEAIGQECDRTWHWEPCRTIHFQDEDGRFSSLKE